VKYGGALLKLIIFAVVTLLLTGALVQTIGNISFASESTYKARFTDITGLFQGNDVKIAGVKVGQVKSTKVVDKRLAELTFTVRKDIRLRRSTEANIKYLNLVGGRFLALEEGPGDPSLLPRGGTIPVANTKPSLDLTVLFNGFKPLFTALNPKDVNKPDCRRQGRQGDVHIARERPRPREVSRRQGHPARTPHLSVNPHQDAGRR